jgi:hypothetical protein
LGGSMEQTHQFVLYVGPIYENKEVSPVAYIT